jgi:uncharacterized membrane protein
MMKVNKKGQSMGMLYSSILIIAAIGIMIALVMYILTSMGSSFQAQDTAASVTNETGYANSTGYTLALSTAQDFANPVITKLYNRTSGTQILVGNVTVSSTGLVTNASATVWPNLSISYTYTYTADTESSNATGTLVNSFVSFLPWLGIILLVLAAGVVLFFVIRSFSGVGRGI